MKFCNIVPTKLIPKYSGDFVMALANYLDPEKENDYERAIKQAGLPIVLDNGAFETGVPDGVDNLIRKAKRLNPAYIFAPDTLFNAKKTRFGYEVFKDIQRKSKTNFKIGIVVQADNEKTYLEEFQKYNEDPDIAVIGLSYLAISHSIKYPSEDKIPKTVKDKKKNAWNVFAHTNYTGDRIKMLEKIANLNLKKIKPLHILGLGESYEDIKKAINDYPYCMYNDTSTCYMVATSGSTLSNNLIVAGGKIRNKINIQDTPGPAREALLKININKVKENICKSTPNTSSIQESLLP